MDVARIGGAKKASMPQNVRPMLATLSEQPFSDPDWLFEVKWDGARAIAHLRDVRVRLASRNLNDITICDLTGTGAQDTAIATFALKAALAGDAGTVISS